MPGWIAISRTSPTFVCTQAYEYHTKTFAQKLNDYI